MHQKHGNTDVSVGHGEWMMQTKKGVLLLTRFNSKAVGCCKNGHKNTRSSIFCLSRNFTKSELHKAQS